MGRIEKQKRELIEESNKRMLGEQEDSNTISSKEILRLEKKEGWESVMGQLSITKIATMSDNFIVVDGKGGTFANAQLDAQTKQEQLGIKQNRLFVITKDEGNSVRVKFLITQ